MAVLNDGQRSFDHDNDGTTQALAGCLRDFRNKPYPTKAKIEYYNNVLTVLFHGGMNNNPNEYEMCLRAENVVLPKHGYFGVSAATGGLADDHDVYHFLTTSLLPYDQQTGGAQPPAPVEDNEKLTMEYEQYQKKLEQQKEDYHKEHPELAVSRLILCILEVSLTNSFLCSPRTTWRTSSRATINGNSVKSGRHRAQ